MSTIQIFDPALCCSSGVCGVDVDPKLTRASADIDWLRAQGGSIERFNLAQQPLVFAQTAAVKRLLERSGQDALPVTLVDGEVALAGRYPERDLLARWAGLAAPAQATSAASACCGGGKCC
jgi:hypothetical protein